MGTNAVAPTILIITGAWHTPFHYASLADALRLAGFADIHIPLLPSNNGSRPPNSDLYTDTAYIRSYIQNLVAEGKNVVVLMHSYGGQVGTNALCGLGRHHHGISHGDDDAQEMGGIKHLVYVCAEALQPNESIASLIQHHGHTHLIPHVISFDADDNSATPLGVLEAWFSTPSSSSSSSSSSTQQAKEREEYVARLVCWNGKAFYDPIERCAWREIPSSYVLGKGDRVLPAEYQRWMVGRVQEVLEVEEGNQGASRMRVVEVEGGHCLNLENLEVVVGVVREVC